MASLEELVNNAFNLSKQRAVQGGTLERRQGTSQARRSASSRGITGAIGSALENRAQRNIDTGMQNRMRDLEIARNTALSGAKQFDEGTRRFDVNRQDTLDYRNKQLEQQKQIARQQQSNSMLSGIGGLIGSLIPGANLIKGLFGGQKTSYSPTNTNAGLTSSAISTREQAFSNPEAYGNPDSYVQY